MAGEQQRAYTGPNAQDRRNSQAPVDPFIVVPPLGIKVLYFRVPLPMTPTADSLAEILAPVLARNAGGMGNVVYAAKARAIG